MKIMEFVDSLEAYGPWNIREEKNTRAIYGPNARCPIWEAYGDIGDYGNDDADDVYEAGRAMGLTTRQVRQFIHVADCIDAADLTPLQRKIRERLLALATTSNRNPD